MRRVLVLLAALGAAAATPASAAYAPRVELVVPAGGGPATPAAVSSTITQADGEDATRTVEAVLPGTFGFNAAFALRGCTVEEERRRACPETSRIGRIEADSPFGSAAGSLFLTEDFRLLGTVDAYGGLVRFDAVGLLEVLPGQAILLRFDGLPDLPVRRLHLAIEGGARTPLALPRDCGEHVIAVRLRSHGGEERRSEHRVTVGGCRAVPFVEGVRPDRRRLAPGAAATVRWRVSGPVARTEVTLRRLTRGRWIDLGRRTVTGSALRLGPRWRGRALKPGRHRVVVVAVAPDGGRSLGVSADLVVSARGR